MALGTSEAASAAPAASVRARRSSLVRVLGAAGAVVIAALASAIPAGAHAQLVKADPGADAVLAAAPERVTLTFAEPVSTVGATLISVVAPDGSAADAGDTVIDGTTVSVSLRPLSAAGAYTVTYRVVSDDGHIINDSYQFQYAPPTAVASDSAAPSAMPDDMTTTAAPQSKGGLHLSVTKIATIAVFAVIYFMVARWLKAYRRRSVGR